MMHRDPYIDFHAVLAEHEAMDARLRNWGRWCHPFYPPGVAPGFELYRSAARARQDSAIGDSIDQADACRINSLVQTIPLPQRAAITWAYTKPIAPTRQARKQGVTLDALRDLLNDARQRLINQEQAAADNRSFIRAGRTPAFA